MLRDTISKIVYRTEYSSSYTGINDPFQNIKVPTHLTRRAAWQGKPCTSQVVQLLPTTRGNKPRLINLQGLEPNRSSSHRRSKSAAGRHHLLLPQNSPQSTRPFSGLSTSSRTRTEDLMPRRPQSLVARRIQSQLSRFPKDFRYIDKQCFFRPAQESYKTFFVISPDWVSVTLPVNVGSRF